MKKCNNCENIFELTPHHFYKCKSSKDGFDSKCKMCKKEYDKKYTLINKEKQYARCREWNKNNKNKLQQSTQKWIEQNPERHKDIKKQAFNRYISKSENKDKRREYDKEYVKQKRINNIEYKIKDSIGSIINYHLKERKCDSTIKYLGCSINDYIVYLENKFLHEMSWDNYGDVWEIDHILPISSYDLNVEENIYKIFNFKNTQPLFKTTKIAESFGYTNEIGNRNKSNKII